MEAEERDITIGPGKLLGLFFMLVAICGVFFAIGYSLGKTTAREQSLNDKAPLSASLSAPVVGDASAAKPSAVVAATDAPNGNTAAEQERGPAAPDLTFFNAVKRSDSSPQSAAVADKAATVKAEPPMAKSEPAAVEGPTTSAEQANTGSKPVKADSTTEVPTAGSSGFVVQIAAVTREEDAAALAGALRKKNYNVFVVNNPAAHDKFYHVQVGPFATLQDAQAMKAKLTGEGYNPIVKKS